LDSTAVLQPFNLNLDAGGGFIQRLLMFHPCLHLKFCEESIRAVVYHPQENQEFIKKRIKEEKKPKSPVVLTVNRYVCLLYRFKFEDAEKSQFELMYMVIIMLPKPMRNFTCSLTQNQTSSMACFRLLREIFLP
jgi:hypothetical protein